MQEQVRCLMLTAPALIVNMMNFYRSKVAHDMSLELARTLDEPRQPLRAIKTKMKYQRTALF